MYTPDTFTTPDAILGARTLQEEASLKTLFAHIEQALEAWLISPERAECSIEVGYPLKPLAEHVLAFYRSKGWVIGPDTFNKSWVFKLPVDPVIQRVTFLVGSGEVPEMAPRSLDLDVELFAKPIPTGPADQRFIVVQRKDVPEGVPMELWTSKETSELHAVNRNLQGAISPDNPGSFDDEYAWAIIANPAWVPPKTRPMTTCRQTIPE
jgi:hypothetical protein